MPIPLGILAAAGFRPPAAAGSYDLIESVLLSSNTASVTFSGLAAYASTYKHLQIRVVTRSNRASAASDLSMRFNGDSTSSYRVHAMDGDGSSVYSFSGANSYAYITQWMPAASATANAFFASTIDILDFASTTKNTTTRSSNGAISVVSLVSNGYFKTDAITSIEVFDRLASLVSGSRLSLYGVKG
jgi:hypothetical protein